MRIGLHDIAILHKGNAEQCADRRLPHDLPENARKPGCRSFPHTTPRKRPLPAGSGTQAPGLHRRHRNAARRRQHGRNMHHRPERGLVPIQPDIRHRIRPRRMPVPDAGVLVPSESSVAEGSALIPHVRQLDCPRRPPQHPADGHLRSRQRKIPHGAACMRSRLRCSDDPQKRRGDALGQYVDRIHGLREHRRPGCAPLRIPLSGDPLLLYQ